MTVDVLVEADIPRPVAVVADYAADPTNAPTWYRRIESIEWEGEPGTRVGARAAFVARFMGRRLVYTYEIIEYARRERLVMRTAEGPFPMETTYTWEPAGADVTHMTLRNRGEPSGFSRLTSPLMVPMMRRANRQDLADLASVLES